MKRSSLLSSLVCSVLATAFVVVGMTSFAEKFDPVAAKASKATTIEVADGATTPCLGCSGGSEPDSIVT